MTLLHTLPEVGMYEGGNVSLEGIASDIAIDMLHAVQNHGTAVGELQSLAADYPEAVASAAAAVMRHAVTASMPTVASRTRAMGLSTSTQTRGGNPSPLEVTDREQEEEDFARAMPESSEVTADQLSFMVRCIQRARNLSGDNAAFRQSSRTLAWLLSRESNRGVVEPARQGPRKAPIAGRDMLRWVQTFTPRG